MFFNLLYFALALFGLGFLIFIHELGHYFMGKRVGMKIEVFSIGMGKPIKQWVWQGVTWQLCYLPFGGYVKFAGDKESECDNTDNDSFYGKKPLDRIKVALAGPLVNIAFAFLIFCVLWFSGGRQKSFSEFTNVIGYVDPTSELYQKGVRPGDQITKYDGHSFNGFKDLILASVLKRKSMEIQGNKVDYYTGETTPYHYTLTPYQHPRSASKDFKTIGVLGSGRFLYFNKLEGFTDKEVIQDGPMKGSGIAYGDRFVWSNGDVLFSMDQLAKVINEDTAMLTVDRAGKRFFATVPRIKIGDLRLSSKESLEMEDWQYEANLKGKEVSFIPYAMNSNGVVAKNHLFLGKDSREYSVYDLEDARAATEPLRRGDKILAVDSIKVANTSELMHALQNKHVKIIVQRKDPGVVSWKNENAYMMHSIDPKNLRAAKNAILSGSDQKTFGNLHILNTVTPIRLTDLPLSSAKKGWAAKEYEASIERINALPDLEKRNEALSALRKASQRLMLGVPLVDLSVQYNPNPVELFSSTVKETARTLTALVTGKLNPKWLSGPIGMVQVVQRGWAEGTHEALFWMAMISLNLGIFNLLPLPVLDGGHICFSLYEMITRRKLKPKVMERLIIPFVVLLIGLFIFVTYQDVMRLFGKFF